MTCKRKSSTFCSEENETHFWRGLLRNLIQVLVLHSSFFILHSSFIIYFILFFALNILVFGLCWKRKRIWVCSDLLAIFLLVWLPSMHPPQKNEEGTFNMLLLFFIAQHVSWNLLTLCLVNDVSNFAD